MHVGQRCLLRILGLYRQQRRGGKRGCWCLQFTSLLECIRWCWQWVNVVDGLVGLAVLRQDGRELVVLQHQLQ